MTGFTRYAIYVVPQGPFYDQGAALLGWDSVAGQPVAQPDVPGLTMPVAKMTATPRKYGFHGTIKPPFRLQQGTTEDGFRNAVIDFCAGLAPVTIPELSIRRLGGFVAAVPSVPSKDLRALAWRVVEGLDPFRAPLTEAELARRRRAGLSPRQEALLTQWGYPYVMEEFRFHLTLTGHLPETDADATLEVLKDHFAPALPRPYVIADLALLGEAQDGRFHVIDRAPLAG